MLSGRRYQHFYLIILQIFYSFRIDEFFFTVVNATETELVCVCVCVCVCNLLYE